MLLGVVMSLGVMAETGRPLMIAHAGGGYLQQNYTNSIEALNHSYERGFRYFEVDFSWTSDDQLVCLHDWRKTFKKLFGFKPKRPLSFADFKQISQQHKQFKVCDLALLADWLNHKKDATLITDIKNDNLKALELIAKKYPTLMPQIIPQFYQPEEYSRLKNMGFKRLIWILYQYEGSKQSVVKHSQNMDLFAVSMRSRQAKNRVLRQLFNQHRVFVYTINQPKKWIKLHNKYGVSGFYTDFLSVKGEQVK